MRKATTDSPASVARDASTIRTTKRLLLVLLALAMTVLTVGMFLSGAISDRPWKLAASTDPSPQKAFVLSDSSIPTEEIRSGGPGKDGIPAMTNPKVIQANRARFLQSNDRVVGVSINGHSRAYPISILIHHEVVNDQVAETPLAITYCPLCDSVVAFDRRTDLGLKEFGVSGLLYNSNVLLYDRSDSESLWSQLMMQGVSGPGKAMKWKVIPVDLTSWAEWLSRHPTTEVLSDSNGLRRDYHQNPYSDYNQRPELMFPASPQDASLPLKERIIAIWDDVGSIVVPVSHFEGRSGNYRGNLHGQEFVVGYDAVANSLRVRSSAEGLNWTNSFWFAWYAFHPDTQICQ